jgi:hypothetical protein
MTDPIEITPEMRRAVYRDDCLRLGHWMNPGDLIRPGMSDELAAQNPTQLPSAFCTRCGRTWVMVPTGGADYFDAERLLYEMLKPSSPLAKTITRLMGQRDSPPDPEPPA